MSGLQLCAEQVITMRIVQEEWVGLSACLSLHDICPILLYDLKAFSQSGREKSNHLKSSTSYLLLDKYVFVHL